MNTPMLTMKTKTWYKDSHSLFDYESNKISQQHFDLEMPVNQVAVFRKKNSSTIKIVSRNQQVDRQNYDLLTFFQIKPSGNQGNKGTYKLEFTDSDFRKKSKKHERLNTEESNSSHEPRESTYIVISKFMDGSGNPTGFKLSAGQIVKLGRVEYFVSQLSFGGKVNYATSKTKNTICNRGVLVYEDKIKSDYSHEVNACKICLDENQTRQNFLINPCKCSGSCGSVHIGCLQQWIHVKVKKQTVGGTVHFNFEKFQCQVCKSEFPMIIQKAGKHLQLLPLEKPNGNYLILEAACEKTKSVMLIQNLGLAGIKLGRGHQCEVRITDISVSRNHALIKNNVDGFYIYDNKSKFGSLVKSEGTFELEVGDSEKAIQIGRTFINLELKKPVHNQKEWMKILP